MNNINLNRINIQTINLDGEVTQQELFDSNGLIKEELLPISIDRFLSLWDCTIGKPTSEPSVIPYTYQTGDYYRVSQVAPVNLIPSGSSYTGQPSTTTYSGAISVGDIFYFDGTVWMLQRNPSSDKVYDVQKHDGTSIVINGIAKLPLLGTASEHDASDFITSATLPSLATKQEVYVLEDRVQVLEDLGFEYDEQGYLCQNI